MPIGRPCFTHSGEQYTRGTSYMARVTSAWHHLQTKDVRVRGFRTSPLHVKCDVSPPKAAMRFLMMINDPPPFTPRVRHNSAHVWTRGTVCRRVSSDTFGGRVFIPSVYHTLNPFTTIIVATEYLPRLDLLPRDEGQSFHPLFVQFHLEHDQALRHLLVVGGSQPIPILHVPPSLVAAAAASS